MKNILYTCPSSGVGGAETVILQTLKHCDKSRFRNHYLLFNKGPLYESLRALKAQVYLFDEGVRLSRIGSHLRISKTIRQLVQEHQIDLVHSTMPYGAIFTSPICWKMGVPHVWFQHGPVGGSMDRVASLLPHKGLIVNSHYTSHRQRKIENPVRFLIQRDFPIKKILLGTDLKKPSPEDLKHYQTALRDQLPIAPNKVLIGMLCRIQKWKGVHILIEAVEKLIERQVSPFHIIIWGEAFKGDQYLRSLKEKVEEKSLPVSFPGLLKEVGKGLSSLDIIVNASIIPEPFGLSVIEGMAMGAIPVVPDQGGPREIVSHGRDGLHFKKENANSLAENLATLINNKSLSLKISQQAQETAQIKFSAKRAIHEIEEFHLEVLGGS